MSDMETTQDASYAMDAASDKETMKPQVLQTNPQFAQAVIKRIMRMDKDVHNATLDGVFAVSLASEMYFNLY
jgi:hypothetical protein